MIRRMHVMANMDQMTQLSSMLKGRDIMDGTFGDTVEGGGIAGGGIAEEGIKG